MVLNAYLMPKLCLTVLLSVISNRADLCVSFTPGHLLLQARKKNPAFDPAFALMNLLPVCPAHCPQTAFTFSQTICLFPGPPVLYAQVGATGLADYVGLTIYQPLGQQHTQINW